MGYYNEGIDMIRRQEDDVTGPDFCGPGHDYTPTTQNVYTMISQAEFEEAFDQAASERQLTFRQAMTYRRAKRNPRVMERVYRRVMEKCPPQIYAGPAGFDFQSFLDWLVENLPAILDLIVKLLPLFLI